MKYKKSHRDQNCKPYASKAIEENCNILEIDIQQAQGEIVLGHNFRPPLKMLFTCTLKDYLDRVVLFPDKDIIIQLDIKEICLTGWSKQAFAKLIVKELLPYINKNFDIIVSANKGFGRKSTMKYVQEYLINYGWNGSDWKQWSIDKDIITVDLWK
jgi:hypothetical protein